MTQPSRKILVCGGRRYADRARAFALLDRIGPDCVVHGGATGADTLAADWAAVRGVEERVCLADWDLHGRAAGPRRNAAMLAAERDGLVGAVAFPGGRGTADMVKRLKAASVPVIEVKA